VASRICLVHGWVLELKPKHARTPFRVAMGAWKLVRGEILL
jgi:hypothetical protein